MSLRINDEAPNFTAETTQGTIDFHDWIGNGWAVLFSHPKDFTPVCTTELGYMAGLNPEFQKRNCKILGLSVDPVTDHTRWAKDIEETSGHSVTYPLIGDPELKIATLYDMLPAGAGSTSQGRTAANNATVRSVFVIGPDKKVKAMLTYPMVGDPELKIAMLYDMLPADAGTTSQGRTAANNATVRSVFVIGPDKKIKAMLTYPMSTGRNFDEVLRILDSVQLTARHQIATPVNWKPGDDVIIAPAVSNEEAQQRYPGGFRAPKPYLRYVPQPQG
jgi:thioredoxin-dependent peroxiredoxin